MNLLRLIGGLLITTFASTIFAAEWNQWRGPARDGVAVDSPALISALPADGIEPAWLSEPILSARSGGWGCPVVADGRVYLYSHTREKASDEPDTKRKYPWLSPDKRGHLSTKQYQEYEVNRRNEDEALGEKYKYHEIVYCLDFTTGKTIWKKSTPTVYTRFLQSGTPAVVDGRLYILGPARKAHCYDAKSGDVIWSVQLPGDFRDEFMMSSFAIADGAAVVLAGHLFGLDIKTGKLLWQGDSSQTRGTHASPIVWDTGDERLIVVNVAGKDTICVEPRSGKERWRISSEANLSTPVISGDYMCTYGNSRKKGLRCFKISPSNVEHAWTYTGLADKGSSPVIVRGNVYVQGEKRLACVDLKSGEEHWRTLLDLPSPQYTSLIAADDKILYTFAGFTMFAATTDDYKPLISGKFNSAGQIANEETFWRLLRLDELEKQPGGLAKAERIYEKEIGKQGPLRCVSPAIVDGKLILRLNDRLAAYDLTK